MQDNDQNIPTIEQRTSFEVIIESPQYCNHSTVFCWGDGCRHPGCIANQF